MPTFLGCLHKQYGLLRAGSWPQMSITPFRHVSNVYLTPPGKWANGVVPSHPLCWRNIPLWSTQEKLHALLMSSTQGVPLPSVIAVMSDGVGTSFWAHIAKCKVLGNAVGRQRQKSNIQGVSILHSSGFLCPASRLGTSVFSLPLTLDKANWSNADKAPDFSAKPNCSLLSIFLLTNRKKNPFSGKWNCSMSAVNGCVGEDFEALWVNF